MNNTLPIIITIVGLILMFVGFHIDNVPVLLVSSGLITLGLYIKETYNEQ